MRPGRGHHDGIAPDGAAVLLRSLDTRIQLYVQKNAPDVR